MLGLYVVTYIYGDGIWAENSMNTYTIICCIFLATVFTFWGIWTIRWTFSSEKSLELNHIGVEYSQLLSNRVKKQSYNWEDIDSFISKKRKNYYLLILKKRGGKSVTLFPSMGMDDIAVKRLLFKLNNYID